MFYLPRICEHCLNPSCAASCPSGAIYKRSEDGIVLVDQDRCRGWRHVRDRLPVQEDLLQPPHRQGREVHVLLPAHRGRHPDRLLRDLRRTAALHRPDALRRRQGARGGVHRGRPRTSTRRSGRCSSTRTTPRWSRAAEQAGIPRDWVDGRPALPDPRADQHLQGGAAAAPGVPHHADGLVHPAAVAGRRRRQGHRLRRGGQGQPVRRDRRPAHPRRVPRRAVHRRRRRAGRRGAAASSPRCAPTCATSTWAATPTRASPRPSG